MAKKTKKEEVEVNAPQPMIGELLMNPLIFADSKTPDFEIPRSC